MKQLFKRWWEGTYVPSERDGFVFHLGEYRRHWTSRAAHVVADFWLRHWQWSVGVTLVVFFGFWKH